LSNVTNERKLIDMNRRKFNISICQCAGFGLLAMTTGISAIANVQRKSKRQKTTANKAERKGEGKVNLIRDPTAVFARIRIGRLRKPMDIGRKFKTDFSFERKPL